MDAPVFMAVLAAAAMHAGWNAFVKLRIDPLLAMALMTACAGLVALPLLAVTGFPKFEAWPWLLGSIVLHLAYYIALTEAYRRAEMSQIYPLARGGAPLITAAVSVLFLGETLTPLQIVAVGVLGGGIMLISLLGRGRGKGVDTVAIGCALLTALTICGYTLVDGIGARIAGDPHAYSAALFVIDGVPLLLFVLMRQGKTAALAMRPYWRQGLFGGTLSLGAYWIAIWAMTVASIPLVAAVRESSVLFAAVIAVVWLKEPLQAPRLIACGMIAAALVLMRIG